MRIPAILFSLLIFPVFCFSQPKNSQPNNGVSLIPEMNKKGLWGYKLEGEKKLCIKPRFTTAGEFSKESVAIVSINENGSKLFGLINQDGNYLQVPVYKDIKLVEDKYYICEDFNNLRGLIALNGELLMPCECKEIKVCMAFTIAETDNGSVLIQRTTSQAIPLIIGRFESIEPMNDYLILSKNGRKSLIDSEGKTLESDFDEIQELFGTFFLVKRPGEVSLSDKTGKKILENCRKIYPSTFNKYIYIAEFNDNTSALCVIETFFRIFRKFDTQTLEFQPLNGTDVLVNGTDICNFTIGRCYQKIDQLVKKTDTHYLCKTNGSEKINALFRTDGKGSFTEEKDRAFDIFSGEIPLSEFSSDFIRQTIGLLNQGKPKPVQKQALDNENSSPFSFQFGNKDFELTTEDGDIYTLPVLYEDAAGRCRFYNTNKRWRGETNVFKPEVHVQINGKTRPVCELFKEIANDGRPTHVSPKHLTITPEGKYILIFFVDFQGRLAPYRELYLFLVNPQTMRVEDFTSRSFADYTVDGAVFTHGNNIYCCRIADKNTRTLSLGNSYDYLIIYDESLTILYETEFVGGIYIKDPAQHNGKAYICGSNQTKGYIDYNNPMLLQVDLETQETNDLSSHFPKEKDLFVKQILEVNDDFIIVQFSDNRQQMVSFK